MVLFDIGGEIPKAKIETITKHKILIKNLTSYDDDAKNNGMQYIIAKTQTEVS